MIRGGFPEPTCNRLAAQAQRIREARVYQDLAGRCPKQTAHGTNFCRPYTLYAYIQKTQLRSS